MDSSGAVITLTPRMSQGSSTPSLLHCSKARSTVASCNKNSNHSMIS